MNLELAARSVVALTEILIFNNYKHYSKRPKVNEHIFLCNFQTHLVGISAA